mmetsp:Transcript_14628/g.22030  ORF Transcript_14628/g.22030 Transcript_14628/m.22030 type:complete len:423 (+) Transcript_14628:41-1309(+)
MDGLPLYKVIRLRGIQSKPHWNDQLALITGELSTERQRYPVMLLHSRDQAWIKPTNFQANTHREMKSILPEQQTSECNEGDVDVAQLQAMSVVLNNDDILRLILGNLVEDSIYISYSGIDFPENLFLVSKKFLNISSALVNSICFSDVSAKQFSQTQLNNIANYFPNLESLEIQPEYEDNTPRIDFTMVRFPKLVDLTLDCIDLQHIHFDQENTPNLERLDIKNSRDCDYIYLDLSHLQSVGFEFVTLNDATDFGPSLSRCSKLESFSSYKLWGLSHHSGIQSHPIINENLESLSLYRSDDLDGVALWCPKLSDLNLQACYSIEFLRLFAEYPTRYMQLFKHNKLYVDYPQHYGQIDVREHEALTINLINANVDPQSLHHLRTHVREIKIMQQPEEHEMGDLMQSSPMFGMQQMFQQMHGSW